MLCPDCKTYAADDEIVCPKCGKLLDSQNLEDEELMNFRQGRHLRKQEETIPPPPAAPWTCFWREGTGGGASWA